MHLVYVWTCMCCDGQADRPFVGLCKKRGRFQAGLDPYRDAVHTFAPS